MTYGEDMIKKAKERVNANAVKSKPISPVSKLVGDHNTPYGAYDDMTMPDGGEIERVEPTPIDPKVIVRQKAEAFLEGDNKVIVRQKAEAFLEGDNTDAFGAAQGVLPIAKFTSKKAIKEYINELYAEGNKYQNGRITLASAYRDGGLSLAIKEYQNLPFLDKRNISFDDFRDKIYETLSQNPEKASEVVRLATQEGSIGAREAEGISLALGDAPIFNKAGREFGDKYLPGFVAKQFHKTEGYTIENRPAGYSTGGDLVITPNGIMVNLSDAKDVLFYSVDKIFKAGKTDIEGFVQLLGSVKEGVKDPTKIPEVGLGLLEGVADFMTSLLMNPAQTGVEHPVYVGMGALHGVTGKVKRGLATRAVEAKRGVLADFVKEHGKAGKAIRESLIKAEMKNKSLLGQFKESFKKSKERRGFALLDKLEPEFGNAIKEATAGKQIMRKATTNLGKLKQETKRQVRYANDVKSTRKSIREVNDFYDTAINDINKQLPETTKAVHELLKKNQEIMTEKIAEIDNLADPITKQQYFERGLDINVEALQNQKIEIARFYNKEANKLRNNLNHENRKMVKVRHEAETMRSNELRKLYEERPLKQDVAPDNAVPGVETVDTSYVNDTFTKGIEELINPEENIVPELGSRPSRYIAEEPRTAVGRGVEKGKLATESFLGIDRRVKEMQESIRDFAGSKENRGTASNVFVKWLKEKIPAEIDSIATLANENQGLTKAQLAEYFVKIKTKNPKAWKKYGELIEQSVDFDITSNEAVMEGIGLLKDLAPKLKEAGIINNVLENYISHLWKDKDGGKGVGSSIKTHSKHAKGRVFKTYYDGLAEGYMPTTLSFTDTIGMYLNEMNNTIAGRRLFNNLKGTMIDGEPIYSKTKVRGYKSATNILFSGKEAFGDTTIYWHPKAWKAVEPLFVPSDFRQTPVVGTFAKINSLIKEGKLTLSAFHMTALAKTAAAYGVNPLAFERGLALIAEGNPTVQHMIKHGLTVHGGAALDIGKRHFEAIPVFRNIVKPFNKMLWDVYYPSMKVLASVKEYNKSLEKFKKIKQYKEYYSEYAKVKDIPIENRVPTTYERIVGESTAYDINNNFGGLNYTMLGRSPKLQEWARMLILAPDWTESNWRMFIDAAKVWDPKTARARMFMLKSTFMFAVTAEMANLAMNGELSTGAIKQRENESDASYMGRMFRQFGKIHVKGFGTFDIYKHLGEWLKITGLLETKAEGTGIMSRPAFGTLGRYVKGKSSLLSKFLSEIISGKDWKGRPFQGPIDYLVKAPANAVLPITLSHVMDYAAGDKEVWEVFSNFLGVPTKKEK